MIADEISLPPRPGQAREAIPSQHLIRQLPNGVTWAEFFSALMDDVWEESVNATALSNLDLRNAVDLGCAMGAKADSSIWQGEPAFRLTFLDGSFVITNRFCSSILEVG